MTGPGISLGDAWSRDAGLAASSNEESPATRATRLIAETRHQCVALGLSPAQFAQLLLPEALLAFMVAGMRQEEVEAAFTEFARTEIPAWFLQLKRTVGYCDCAREAHAEHAADCASLVRL